MERCFGTLQSRLITEFKIAKIKTIEAANDFLTSYINHYNKSNFVLRANDNMSVFEPQLNLTIINQTLTLLNSIVIDKGCGITFNNKYYQPYKNNKLVVFKNKTKCLVIKCFDQQLLAYIENEIYELKELMTHQKLSPNFDFLEKKIKPEKSKYIPPLSHPWKQSSWKKYLNSRKHWNKNSTNI